MENLKDEIWKDVQNYEGHYMVSNMGRIKSLKCNRERLLNPWDNGRGYVRVELHNGKDELAKKANVHQLVAIHFLGHNPSGMTDIVDHKNQIKSDNRASNLRITTNRVNCSYKRSNSSSKYIGVCWSKAKQRWHASIKTGNKQHFLGRYKDEDDAGAAYQSALKMINDTGFFNFVEWKKSRK